MLDPTELSDPDLIVWICRLARELFIRGAKCPQCRDNVKSNLLYLHEELQGTIESLGPDLWGELWGQWHGKKGGEQP